MYIKHEDFIEPQNINSKIWRYISLIRLISLLDKKALFFTRVDKFKDPFEGSYPNYNLKMRPEIYKEISKESLEIISKGLSNNTQIMRKFIAVNCWHINEYQSDAMWGLYCRNAEGIAIQSTFKRLAECFDNNNEKIYIGKVAYIDYDNEWMPEGNIFYPFVHKRKSFEHENELRAVIWKLPASTKGNGSFDPTLETFPDGGAYIDIDVNKLIEKIYLAPFTPKWIIDLTKSILEKYDFNFDIVLSDLYERPVY